MSFSNVAEQRMLETILAGSYLGLVTTAPTETTPGTEVAAADYSRVSWAATYTQGTPTTASNSATVEFPQATSSWGTVTHVVLFSAAVGGDYLGSMELRDPNDPTLALSKSVTSGDVLRFLAGALTFEIE